VNHLSSIVDENEELSYSELNDDDFDEMDDLGFENHNLYGMFTYIGYLLYKLIYYIFMTTSL